VSVHGLSAPQKFRPDLEGLRAVAVLLVVLFHAGVPGFSGGYIGVDVFYVLSGFFITGMLLSELKKNGRLNFSAFYARRLKRLVPASAIVLAVTIFAGAFIVAPLSRHSFGWDAIASAWDVSNVRYAFQATDYLASTEAPSPLLHYWSLAVETQFYLVWPALLALVAIRRGASQAALVRRVAVILTVLIVVSLGLSVWLTQVNQPMAFFMLPTRAWELALGGLLALAPVGLAHRRLLGQVTFGVGIAVILAVGMLYTQQTPFPGWAAVPPVGATALVIVASQQRRVARTVVNPVGSFLGKASYSLYLWHWPILVLVALAVGHKLSVEVNLVLMIGAGALAWLTFRFVEDPIRKLSWSPARSFLTMGTATVLVTIGGLLLALIPLSGGKPGAVPIADPTRLSVELGAALEVRAVPADLAPSLEGSRNDQPIIYANGCHQTMGSEGMPECVFGDPAGKTQVWLVGDSHAAQWFPALNALAKEKGWKLVSHTYSGCPTTSTVLPDPKTPGAKYVACHTWQNLLLEKLTKAHPDLVVVGAATVLLPDAMAGFVDRLSDFSAASKRVAVMGDTPHQAQDVPPCVSAHMSNAAFCATARGAASVDIAAADLQAAAQTVGAAYANTLDWLCTESACPVIAQNVLFYRDAAHITPEANVWLSRVFNGFIETALSSR
jgi:peptidoglycan/LPS O-acetylase OafA/YrhL